MPPNRRRDETALREIRGHVVALFDAYIAWDLNTLVKGRTRDWKGFLIGSTGLIRGSDEYRREMAKLIDGFRVDSYEFLEFEIELFGDLALVFYVARDRIADDIVNGASHAQRTVLIRSIDVYAHRDGSWIQAASNICAVPDPADPMNEQ